MKIKEISDKDWMLYLAFIAKKLSDFKYEVYGMTAKMPEELKRLVMEKAPINIDASQVVMETIRRAKPEMYRESGKSIGQHEKELEAYINELLSR